MEYKKIGELFPYVSRGKSPKYVDNSDICIINQACIRWDGIDYTKVKYQAASSYREDTCLYDGDILLTSTGTGTLGRCCVFHRPDQRVYVADSHVTVLRGAVGILPDIVCLYLRTQRGRNKLYAECVNGSTSQIELSKEKLRLFVIPVPTMTTQKALVSQITHINKIIELRKTELFELNALVKARFVEMFGDPVKNGMGWASKPLNDVCDGIGDGLHGTPVYDDNGDYPFINGNNLNDGKIVITPATKMVATETYEKHFINISLNAILISINGTLGKLAFYNGEKVMLGKSACYCNLQQNINKVFVYGVMKSDAFAEFLENSSTKSTIKNVGLKAMREFKLILPPKELQEQFATFVEQTDKSKAAVQKVLDEAQMLFDSLMQQYFG